MQLDRHPDVLEALNRSSLRDLPRSVIDRFTEGATVRNVAGGTALHRSGDAPPFQDLVVLGLIRAWVDTPDGRSLTIRYCRPGALMGTGTLFYEPGLRLGGNLNAVVDSRVVAFRPETVRALVATDIRVTHAFLRETGNRINEYILELQASALASVRQRLARHLLDLASEGGAGGRPVARSSQAELAGAIGTVREMVVRILGEMRREGLVRTGRGRIELLDPVGLDAETFTRRPRSLV